MIRLMNSNIMPAEGHYTLKKISKEEFCKILIDAYITKNLESYIGYQDNINLIKKWTGITVPFSRENTILEDGDILLTMKLTKRIGDPTLKGKLSFNEEDFEFYIAEYKAFKGGK